MYQRKYQKYHQKYYDLIAGNDPKTIINMDPEMINKLQLNTKDLQNLVMYLATQFIRGRLVSKLNMEMLRNLINKYPNFYVLVEYLGRHSKYPFTSKPMGNNFVLNLSFMIINDAIVLLQETPKINPLIILTTANLQNPLPSVIKMCQDILGLSKNLTATSDMMLKILSLFHKHNSICLAQCFYWFISQAIINYKISLEQYSDLRQLFTTLEEENIRIPNGLALRCIINHQIIYLHNAKFMTIFKLGQDNKLSNQDLTKLFFEITSVI